MTKKIIIEKVQALFAPDHSGHDFFHTERVYRTAMGIAEHYSCNCEIVALAALLHDVDDPKLFSTKDYSNARKIMAEAGIDGETAREVIAIISKMSFRGTGAQVPESLEGKIVQDADRLDAIGAIGIARAFAYGGNHNRKMHDPAQRPNTGMDEDTYRSQKGTTINHFYEKLLLLKDLMNTEYAKTMAENRTQIMEAFLAEFMDEWDGRR